MPKKGSKGRKNIILVFSILLFSLALMSLSAKQQKEMSYLDSLTSLILSPFQSLFTKSFQSVSNVINNYFYLVSVSKENERLKLEVDNSLMRKMNLSREFFDRRDLQV